ncbi:YDG domain-containing protein [Steroidobacter cummioxidans]|uniref:YDG domain-containing protein n=1 Tax=Steroidobacter cummioxidans TaxID=1803913 RepID=UPI000E31AEFB|nr:YDG domain-containing protein [Steroidobacter cummioxidans]
MKRPSLNHVYRLVWNERLNAWVAVAEHVKARGKRASGALSLAVLMALGLAPATHAADNTALPTNGQIVAGQGSIHQQGNTLTLNQNSNRLIAQWDTFNIGKDASVVFNQASSNSVALNRILDSNPSEIFGSLSANGQVYLVNPSGIVFGRGAQVNVGGLVASSLNISNEDFLAGNLKFSGSDTSGAVINQGSISAAQGGVAALLAPQVTNGGSITANGGSALLAAGSGVSLDFVGDGLISYNIDAGTTRALVQNGGLVQADGGLAVLTAKAADAVNQAVVNNTGTVRAQTLASREGRILLLSDMEHGTTINNGTLDASAAGSGDGGFIETSAGNVSIGENSLIDTRAAHGEVGEWLLDPSDIIIAASGGTMTGATLAAQLNSTNVTLDTSAGSGGNGDIFINDAVTSTGSYVTGGVGSGRTLTLRATRNIEINNTISGNPYPLSVVLRASGDVSFGSSGVVNTNGGNFVVGIAPTAIGNMATASGTNFSMSNGSYVSVGSGSLDINVTGSIQLAANSLRTSGSTYRYLNSGYTDYIQSSYMRLLAGTGITTINTDAAVADITGMTYVTLQSASIGTALAPIKIGRTSLGHSLTVNNSSGNSYANVLNANASHGFSTVSVNIGSQLNSTQQLLLGGDLDGHGHILMNTDGSGVLSLLDDDIDTAGTRSNISISAGNITFDNNSVDVGSRSFSATATTMAGSGNDGNADVIGGTLSFYGTELGSTTHRLEVAGGGISGGANTLNYSNSGGNTYVTSVDDSFQNVYMTNVKTIGTHSVLFDTDHIDYTTDGTGVLVPRISVNSGADVSGGNRFISFATNSGDIRFDTDSVNTGSGTLQAVINAGNPDGASGDVIHAVNAKDGQAEITTGNAEFIIYRSGTGRIADIELAQGAGASNNSLSVSTYAGNVDLTELDSHHFKSLSVTLNGSQANGQNVAIDLNGADDLNFTDGASRLVLDDTKVALSDFDRNWQLSAGNRNVQIDSTALGSGNYNIYANNLYLNGDVLTDGGNITLNAASNNIYLMNSVRIDSNADDVANSTSTGAAGNISLTGNISSSNGAGRILTVDSSSTSQAGGTIYMNGNLGNTGGSYLSGASFTTKGSQDNNDGSLTFTSSSFLLDGNFSAIGNTNFSGTFLDVVIDTEQGNDGDAGDISFGGMGLTGSQYSGYTFNASTTAAGRNGGNVDLDTLNHGTFSAKTLVVNTTGSSGGATGNIDLPAVSTAGTYYNGTTTNQSYTGNVITLHGNLSTNGGNVTLAGDTQLAESVTIRTSIANPSTAAGSVSFTGTGVSATAPGKDLTINTSTSTSSAYNAGAVTLRTGSSGGATINNLSVETRALGTGGSSADITLATGIQTGGNQTFAARNVSASGDLTSPGAISITNAGNQTFSLAGTVTADSLLLRGGTFTLANAANQINTLAAQSGALTYANSGALTIGSIGGISGITSSGQVNISTGSGDLRLANSVSSTNTGASAVVLNAGSSASAGTAAGGNILVNNGVTVVTGTGGRATLYSGDIDGSTGLTNLVGFGSGNFRYNSDESASGYTKALGAGVYAIYREQPTVSVDVDDATAVYGGAPTLTTTIVSGRNGDASTNFTYAIGGAQSTSGNYIVGTHSIAATSSSGAAELGYNVSTMTGGTLTITPKELTVSGLTADRAYDGTTNASLNSSGASVSGLLGGDLVGQDYSSVAGAFDDKNVGTGKHVTINGITLTGADAANYTVTSSGTGNISARVLNVGFTGVNRVYDGTTSASVVSNDDRVGTDALTINQTASFGDKNVGTGKLIDVSNVTLSGADAGNYVLGSASGTATGDIAARTLNVGFTGANRVYDGTTAMTVTSSDDRVAGDDLAIDQSAVLADKNVGTGKIVNISNVTVSGADASNYVLGSTSGTATADIAARTLILGYTGDGKKFDGTPRAGVSVSDNRVAGDSLGFDVNAHYTDFTVGDNREVLINGVTLSGADAGNYVIANPTGSTTANIEPGSISNDILASITSPQSTSNGTSSSSEIYARNISIGAGAGSGSLIQNASHIITDNRVITIEGGFTLDLGKSLHNVSLSKFPTHSTLSIGDVPAKIEERSGALPLFEARNSTVRLNGAVEIIDSGNSLSVSNSSSGSAASIDLNQTFGPTASGKVKLPGGQELTLETAIHSNQVLSILVPKDAPFVDYNDLAVIGVAMAVQQLDVKPRDLKAIVIKKR